MINNQDILNKKWLRGKVEFIGKRTKTGLIKSEDGSLLIEFDESALNIFENLHEHDDVLFTLEHEEPDARGILKAQNLLSVKTNVR